MTPQKNKTLPLLPDTALLNGYVYTVEKKDGDYIVKVSPTEEGYELELKVDDLENATIKNACEDLRHNVAMKIRDALLDNGPVLITRRNARGY